MAVPCPACGTQNADGADWCNLCYTALVVDENPPADPAPVGRERPVDAGPRPERAAPAWTCPVCDADNPIDIDRCATCGTAMVVAFTPPGEKVDGERAKLWSAIPGMGHAKAGAGPIGGGILLLVLMAVGFGIVLFAAPATRVMGTVILFAGGGVWVASAFDVQRHVDHGGPWLFQPRVISVVAGVILALLFASVLIAMAAGGPGGG